MTNEPVLMEQDDVEVLNRPAQEKIYESNFDDGMFWPRRHIGKRLNDTMFKISEVVFRFEIFSSAWQTETFKWTYYHAYYKVMGKKTTTSEYCCHERWIGALAIIPNEIYLGNKMTITSYRVYPLLHPLPVAFQVWGWSVHLVVTIILKTLCS